MPVEAGRHDKWYVGYLICIFGFGLVIWAFYPGMMSPDSIAALTSAREGSLADINAPLMSYMWGLLDRFLPGPGGMLVLQAGMFWGACALLWRAVYPDSFKTGLALVLLGFLPHILAQTVVIWKDVAMGTSLLFAVASIYLAKKGHGRTWLLISPVFLFYAYSARLNALPAVLPIAFWSVSVFFRIFEINRSKLFAVAAGTAYFLVLTLGVYAVTYGLTGGRTAYPFQQVYLHDLAALSVAKGEPLFPGYIQTAEHFSFDKVKSRYNERSVSDLIYPDVPAKGDMPVLKLSDSGEDVAVLRSVWWSAVKGDPAGYLAHRTRIFAQLTGLSRSVTAPYWEQGFSSSPPEYRVEENVGTRAAMGYFKAFRRPVTQTFFFRAVIWIILSAFFLYKAVRRGFEGDWDIVAVLSASTLLFVGAYFPTTPSTEFRYLFWPAISSALTVIIGIYLLSRGRKAHSNAPEVV